MKKRIVTAISILLLIGFNAIAQEAISQADVSKIISKTYPKTGTPIPCTGVANTESVDLKWKPILTKKFIEIEHENPNQEYIDSIKAEKMLLKKQYEATHKSKGNTERTMGSTPVIGKSFAGNTNSGYSPLDNNIAISYGGQIVSVANTTISCYDTNGVNSYFNTIISFLPSSYGVKAICDPVILYDASSDRFIFFCQEISSTGLFSNNRIFICFSKDNNPNDSWYCYTITGDPTGTGCAFDYPKLAVNDSELFITGNLYAEPSGAFSQSIIYQFDKLAGYAAGTLTWDHYSGITGKPFTLLPVSYGQYGSINPGMYLVSTDPGGSSSIDLFQVTANLCCSPSLNGWSVPTTVYSPAADALQLGTSCKLNTNSCRALNGFFLDSYIHFVFHSDYGSGYAGINYNRLNVNTLTNQSSLVGNLGYDFCYPAVASFATSASDKSVMIGFDLSGSTMYPAIGVINCDDLMNWSTYATVQTGPSYASYTSDTLERWGDYSGMARNHSSATPSVWMAGMFADTSNKWESWIAEIGGVPNLGITEPLKQPAKVYPNPISNLFTVEFPLTQTTDLNIYIIDMNGRIVKNLYSGKGTAGDNVFSFDKSNLSGGVYFLTIRSDSKIIKNEKIVIVD